MGGERLPPPTVASRYEYVRGGESRLTGSGLTLLFALEGRTREPIFKVDGDEAEVWSGVDLTGADLSHS